MVIFHFSREVVIEKSLDLAKFRGVLKWKQ